MSLVRNKRLPDINAPRFKKTYMNVINKDFLNEFKELHPEYKDMKEFENVKTSSALAVKLNDYICKHVIENRDGIDLPERLGVVFVASKKPKTNITDLGESIKHKQIVKNLNLETNGLRSTILYSKHTRNHGITISTVWSFFPCRNFKRAVSKAFRKNYLMYRRIERKYEIEKLFKERKGITVERDIRVYKSYNEFE